MGLKLGSVAQVVGQLGKLWSVDMGRRLPTGTDTQEVFAREPVSPEGGEVIKARAKAPPTSKSLDSKDSDHCVGQPSLVLIHSPPCSLIHSLYLSPDSQSLALWTLPSCTIPPEPSPHRLAQWMAVIAGCPARS